jgi:hypothetical protein
MQGLNGYLEQRTVYACLMLALHTGSGPMSLRWTCCCMFEVICIWPHTLRLFLFLGFVYFSVCHLSLSQFQGKESKDHSTDRRTICAARPFTKFVSGSSPTPRQSGASSEAHLGRPQQHSEVHFHDFLPKTSLRGIGLCNGHDTNFPYKWTSSTYSQ